MAVASRADLYLGILARKEYDGSTPIAPLLQDFDAFTALIQACDSSVTDDVIALLLRSSLRSPVAAPPAKGVDGHKFLSPPTWLSRQKPADIDTYSKLKAALLAKFSPPERNEWEILDLLDRMPSPDWTRLTVEEFIEDFEEVAFSPPGWERQQLPDELLVGRLLKRLPTQVLQRLGRQLGASKMWVKPWDEIKKRVVEIDEKLRYRSPMFRSSHTAASESDCESVVAIGEEDLDAIEREAEALHPDPRHRRSPSDLFRGVPLSPLSLPEGEKSPPLPPVRRPMSSRRRFKSPTGAPEIQVVTSRRHTAPSISSISSSSSSEPPRMSPPPEPPRLSPRMSPTEGQHYSAGRHNINMKLALMALESKSPAPEGYSWVYKVHEARFKLEAVPSDDEWRKRSFRPGAQLVNVA
ncbi:hypothetical protein FN846DRAFT_885548 [Sphaerosporella brunnea]|uniref:Uncharacterized protein n=1 Tax=Sphaerosporella brunnea TaxID=1250544 RepID=A0A5J5FBZ9_9PEZI|nr:hypothetical protein FN846DRAFT_885548 [Sphaerosporella brunnea]